MMNPSPEGTEVRVRISHAEATFTASAGLTFTSVDAAQLSVAEMDWGAESVSGYSAGSRTNTYLCFNPTNNESLTFFD